MEGRDRRRAVRVPVEIEAVAELLDAVPWLGPVSKGAVSHELAGRRFPTTIVDLSTQGARLLTSDPPSLMSRVSLVFDVPGHGSTLAACVVMWRQPAPPLSEPGTRGSFGVQFEALDFAARSRIAALSSG